MVESGLLTGLVVQAGTEVGGGEVGWAAGREAEMKVEVEFETVDWGRVKIHEAAGYGDTCSVVEYWIQMEIKLEFQTSMETFGSDFGNPGPEVVVVVAFGVQTWLALHHEPQSGSLPQEGNP